MAHCCLIPTDHHIIQGQRPATVIPPPTSLTLPFRIVRPEIVTVVPVAMFSTRSILFASMIVVALSAPLMVIVAVTFKSPVSSSSGAGWHDR